MGNIIINDLYFRYDSMPDPIFDHLNLAIDESWRLGLIGRNGRGKTTFLKILLGELKAQGKITTNLKFNYFPQPVSDEQMITRDVLMGISNLTFSDFWRVEVELDKLKVNQEVLERPFVTLSPGEQTKVLLGTLFSDHDSFQLIDEPTNHLDSEGRQVVAEYLKSKQGFIVISHDRAFINQVIDHVISIDRSKIQLFNGNYETWQQAFDQQNQAEMQKKQELQGEINRLKQAADKSRRWSESTESKKSQSAYKHQGHVNLDKGFLGHKAAKIMKRSKGITERTEKQITEKQSLLKNLDDSPELTMNFVPLDKQPLLQLNDFQVSRNNHPLNKPINVSIQNHDRIALTAPNGFGKSTIVKGILGDATVGVSGQVTSASGIKISYVSQDFETISGDINEYATEAGIEISEFLNMLRKLGFERETFTHDLSEMSWGQKRKVALARSLVEEANLYLWDEPLNYLDIITRQQIESLILQYNPPMLIIDHDQEFIKRIVNKEVIKLQPAD
ncbi:ribosomal protection-like ABC-F family protein [Lentilactobacillus sp. SPB1-3]|uniref:Ribosomal protection-like ABC-F family protein n=1 Tax=Lentilactobacillus terminaliae TaxID=3003483 RepID=A0ACD5DEF5_9LACO|nr:ATP-binding cassette domain-containing protein [Lentilactobacillus sp. SPB1-3]MCZ0977548.1 ATP-binding cassette domain-containing protein [Lentilactobacillus sp. SPB1-3]